MVPSRFATDSSLAPLARWLRFLGYDVTTHAGSRLEELLEAAREDGRTVLTLSDRHPRKFAQVSVIRVERGDPDPALAAIALAHLPSSAPFARCPECNAVLERRLPMQAVGEVPGRVLRRSTSLHHCTHCGRWYWDGSHTARIRVRLERVLGRPLEASSDAPPAADDSSG